MKKGISLIVLVITIIVLAILAGAIIISISNTNVMTKATEAVKASDKANAQYILSLEYARAVASANDGKAYQENKAPTFNEDGSVKDAGKIMTATQYVAALNKAGIYAVSATDGDKNNTSFNYYVTVNADGVPTLNKVEAASPASPK